MTVIYVCKIVISSGVFSIFLKILIFWVQREVKGQKAVQNDKKICLSPPMSQEPYIIWLLFMFLKWQYLQVFFLFFWKFWFSGSIGQKTVQNDKKLCQLCSISLEPYIIWLSFMVQMCKMTMSPGVFLNNKIMIFQVVKGLKGQKMAQNVKNFCL